VIDVERSGKHISRFVFDTGSVVFNLELRGHVTVFEGHSSTGKTYFLKSIYENYPNFVNAFKKHGISDVVYVNAVNTVSDNAFATLLDTLKKRKGCLVLIDNGDKVLNGRDKLLKHISVDSGNQYVICSRGGVGLGVSPNHYGELKQEGDEITSAFHWNERGWG
jgi:hypothetical protein